MVKIQFTDRKAIIHGYSLFVNLPRQFCKDLDIQQGDYLEVYWDKNERTLLVKKKEERNDNT